MIEPRDCSGVCVKRRVPKRGAWYKHLYNYPPAIAPMMKNGSAPFTIGSGRGVSGDSWEMSSPQAKNRTSGRRLCVSCSRIVPRNVGYLFSSASSSVATVAPPLRSTWTSSPTFASVRRWCGSMTRITLTLLHEASPVLNRYADGQGTGGMIPPLLMRNLNRFDMRTAS
jgi:hypothetical protein